MIPWVILLRMDIFSALWPLGVRSGGGSSSPQHSATRRRRLGVQDGIWKNQKSYSLALAIGAMATDPPRSKNQCFFPTFFRLAFWSVLARFGCKRGPQIRQKSYFHDFLVSSISCVDFNALGSGFYVLRTYRRAAGGEGEASVNARRGFMPNSRIMWKKTGAQDAHGHPRGVQELPTTLQERLGIRATSYQNHAKSSNNWSKIEQKSSMEPPKHPWKEKLSFLTRNVPLNGAQTGLSRKKKRKKCEKTFPQGPNTTPKLPKIGAQSALEHAEPPKTTKIRKNKIFLQNH